MFDKTGTLTVGGARLIAVRGSAHFGITVDGLSG
jgi:hypothetical protein